MMGQPKPLASLSSGLLARKGQARPAMRPQGFSGFGSVTGAMDDLGWNDMGPAEALMPAHPIVPEHVADLPAAGVPPVLVDRAALQDEFQADATDADDHADEPAPVIEQLSQPKRGKAASARPLGASKPMARPVVVAKGKAAFTLRLDADRHLRLRLASALRHQSAQQLVTAALDALLAQMPEVETLAVRAVPHSDHDAEAEGQHR